MQDLSIKVTGDSAICVTFSGQICIETNLKVRALQLALEQQRVRGILETIPAYCSLMIHYDPLKVSYHELVDTVRNLALQTDAELLHPGTVTQIPVLYGGDYGPDIYEVAQFEGITVQEVIRRHSAKLGFIYMIAFAPGLPYIGSLAETFSVPRRSTPREKLPAGSVTVWQSQTTVFPVEQPGGWNVIGRTPLRLFNKENIRDPFLLQAGNWVEFVPIDQQAFDRIQAQVQAGTYRPVVYKKGEK